MALDAVGLRGICGYDRFPEKRILAARHDDQMFWPHAPAMRAANSTGTLLVTGMAVVVYGQVFRDGADKKFIAEPVRQTTNRGGLAAVLDATVTVRGVDGAGPFPASVVEFVDPLKEPLLGCFASTVDISVEVEPLVVELTQPPCQPSAFVAASNCASHVRNVAPSEEGCHVSQ